MKKRFLALAMSVMLAVGMAGCGETAVPANQTEVETQTQEATEMTGEAGNTEDGRRREACGG